MKRIILFPGWPSTKRLLKPFITELRKSYPVSIYGSKSIHTQNEELILISYSAGVRPLLDFYEQKQRQVTKAVLIAPAGAINRKLKQHCSSFLAELLVFFRSNPLKAGWTGLESLINILIKPASSWKEINKIRKFDLITRINTSGIKQKEVFIINFPQDRFMYDRNTLRRTKVKRFRVPGCHFRLLKDPNKLAVAIKNKIIK